MQNNSKKPLTNTNYYLILGLVTLLAVGVSGFVSKNFVSSILHSNKVITAKQAADSALTADKDAAPKLIKNFNALSASTLATIHDALPSTPDFPSLITMIELQGALSGVKIGSISPDTSASATGAAVTTAPVATADPTAQEYPFVISATGTYPALVAFLATIELSARPLHITDLALSGTNNNMTASISMTTYYQGAAALPFGMEPIK